MGRCNRMQSPSQNRKKKKDHEALASAFMRIPRMNALTARCFLDMGISEIFQLSGRCPEALFADSRKKRPELPQEHLYVMRLAVYYAENESHEKHLLYPEAWKD